MGSIFILALLSFLSSAIPLLSRQSKAVSPFVVQVNQPGCPIHLFSLNANNGHFWFGKATSSSCPANTEPQCPTGTQTAFIVSSDGHATLNTAVPSGQAVYVAKDGALSFTKAHAGNLTAIAYPSGFSFSYYYDDNNSALPIPTGFGSLTFSETPSKGWLACPVTGANSGSGPWQVYAFIRGVDSSGCMEFEAKGEGYGGEGVWQYD